MPGLFELSHQLEVPFSDLGPARMQSGKSLHFREKTFLFVG
jgi:hypothetical protein